MRVLVTGAVGQLGVALLRTAPKDVEVVGLSHAQCDITDPTAVDAAISMHRPALVINAAAYTAVEGAESHSELAHAVNATGAGNVAQAAERSGARIIHISTDYVFDGASREPYSPNSPTNPINVYGASKLAGEKEVEAACSNFLTIRSGWLYSSHGNNFLRTIVAALQVPRPLRVVNDQLGVPTSARGLASTIWACSDRSELRGVHHWVEGGTASWYEFAVAIQQVALEHQVVTAVTPIAPCRTEEYPSVARRPPYSVLDSTKLVRRIGSSPVAWPVALRREVITLKRTAHQ